jgi:hypothetical protein
MKKYKIKLEDKIAFLNKVEKVGVKVNTNQIKDDIVDDPHFFTVIFTNPEDIEKVDSVLSQSSKINQVKEILRRIIREELSK